jgi:hypothetical protein
MKECDALNVKGVYFVLIDEILLGESFEVSDVNVV